MYNRRIQCVYFSLHTAEEIKTLAVKKVTNPQTYDALLHPTKNGFLDPAFGPNDRNDLCDTCGLGSMHCPGHFGYVELPLPVYHPMFFQLMLKILRGSCIVCHRLVATMSKSHLFIRQCELLEKGLLTETIYMKDIYGSAHADGLEASATQMHLQKLVCDQMDDYYNKVVENIDSAKRSSCTKNLVQHKLEVIKDFFVQLGKKGDCPHCGTPHKTVRQEYNTRVYFKVSQSTARKASQIKKTAKKSNGESSRVQEGAVARRLDESQDDILDEDGNEDSDDDDDRDGDGNQENDKESSKEDSGKVLAQEYITPDEVKQHMIQLWNTEGKVMECLLGSYNLPFNKKKVSTPEIFFLDVVAVPPSKFRPQAHAGEKAFENPQTANLSKILWHVKLVEEIMKRIRNGDEDEGTTVTLTSEKFQKAGGAVSVPGASFKEQLNNAWAALQSDVNTFMDSSLNKLNRTTIPGVRQLLEKKEGLFRKHMMGKRVNYACRSVISPDPYINTDEIGVPMVFASKLTYPEPVTPWNLNQLKRMVVNGPNKYPGAMMVEFEDGRKKTLSKQSETERKAIANQLLTSSVASSGAGGEGNVSKGKKVHRHLINGDIMLLNRQPTLHKPSIMAHKVKVLPKERTLRLHYANCKSYNADFDGDEMNAHFPQSELGRAEAYNLASTNFNYLSPKDGKPLAGLIQDHVVSGVRMTSRDTLFNRSDYQQLIFNALIDKPGRIKLVPPCILKPVPMWSGKQIFSSVLLNIIPDDKPALNMAGNKAKVSDDNWPKGKGKKSEKHSPKYTDDPLLKENQVIIRGGELMTGILDKTQYGATAFSLVHCVYELYGGVISGKLLSALARLFTAYLQHAGFTLGVEDILVLPPAEEKRREILEEGRQCGNDSALEAVNLKSCDRETLNNRLQEAHFNNQGAELKQLDLAMKSRTDAINNKVNSVCMRGLLKKFPSNSLQLMVQSGAKGSTVNTMQISCLLGQIELEGRRPPLSVSGRSLPSFVPYDTSPRAGGFVDGRFLTGIRPQEYFFHCMAGREGLIDTAVKTSRSGYLQRCLIKHLEALYVQYDMTVRDGDGSVVQFLYGEDSVDVMKCQYLQTNQFKTVADNYQSYVNILKPTVMSKVVDVKKTLKLQKKQNKWKRNHGDEMFSSRYSHTRQSAFNLFEKENRRKIQKKYPSKERKNGKTEADLMLFKKWWKASETRKASYLDKCGPSPDPSLSKFNPACYFGAVSEKFRACVEDYIAKNPDDMLVEDDHEDDDDEEKSENKRRGCTVNKGTFLPMMLIKYMRSLVEPGEAVGLLAGQSVGEPSTQMTLNTFHFAGRGEMNVTLGIPRLREILMTASEAIKTPQMNVLIKSGEEENAKMIARSFTRLTLLEVLQQVSVTESLEKSYLEPMLRCREFTIRFEILPSYTYEDTTVVDAYQIMTFIETEFFVRIIAQVSKIMRSHDKDNLLNSRAAEGISTTRAAIEGSEDVAPDEPDDMADLSDDDLEGDGGVDDQKLRNRRTQFTSYDDPDAKQLEMDEDRPGSPETPDNVKMDGIFNMSMNGESQQEDIKPKIEPFAMPENPRVVNVLRRDRRITGYVVDEENQWCEVTVQFPLSGSKVMLVGVVEKLAEKAVIHSSPGISRAMVTESKDPNEVGRSRLKTEGVNIQELWKYPEILSLETLYSNNVHKIAKTYGIEAARCVLIKEVQDVFKVYGIHIDVRHLSLIADYMTYEGVYKPFNRNGIQSNPFPFQKMSFETSMGFLRAATAFGQPDELGSPSSRIIVGRVVNQGTGMMDLLPKLTV